jgi:hypothetical protein
MLSKQLQVTTLNCFGLGLTGIRETLVFPALAVFSASSNDLQSDSLTVLSHSPCLRELYLRNNQISGPLAVLSQLPSSLRILWLEGNPIASLPGYRAAVVSMMPLLESLDGESVTPEEKRAVGAPGGTRFGGQHELGDPTTSAVDERAPLAEAIRRSGAQRETQQGRTSRGGAGAGGGTVTVTSGTAGSAGTVATTGTGKESSVLRAVLLLLRELTPEEQAVVARACR